MGKPFKIILSGTAALALLLIMAICLLPLFINANHFKPDIAVAVKDKLGRELELDGDIKLSLIPWIGISTGKATLANTEGFQGQPFATIEQSGIKIQLLPLFSKKIEVSHILLKGLVLNLARDRQGITNWGNPAVSEKASTAIVPVETNQQTEPAIAAFAIGSVSIENAQIHWDDFKSEKHIAIQHLNLNAGKFSFDGLTGIAASFDAMDKLSQSTVAIKLNTELSVNEQLDTFALRHNALQLTPSNAFLTVADIALDTAKQTVTISGLLLKAGDATLSADLTGTSIKDGPSFSGAVSIAPFNPANLIKQMSLPPMAIDKLAAHFDLATTGGTADLQNLVMILDESQIKGSVGCKDFASPSINFNLDVDALDVDRYLPASDKNAKVIASPGMLMAASVMALPNKLFGNINAEGALSLGKLKINGLSMQSARINLSSKNGVITAQQTVKQFYQGHYNGSLILDKQADKPKLSVNEKMDHVQLEPLLKDFQGKARISGMVNTASQLQAQGSNADELKATLGGQLSFTLVDGAVKGFNLQKIIDEGKALFNGSVMEADYKNEQTLFTQMTGTATITNGLIQNNDLVANSSKLRVNGQGSLNLNTDALDYKIDAKLLGDGAEPIKGEMTLNMAGTLGKPTYSIDLSSLLSDKNKAKIDKLINKIDKKIGPGLGNLLKGFIK